MNDRGQKAGVLRFRTFDLDFASGELRKGGALVKLQSQHFQLLALLAERAGQVASREEIRRALWDNETFVDFAAASTSRSTRSAERWTTIRRNRGISKHCLARVTASLRR